MTQHHNGYPIGEAVVNPPTVGGKREARSALRGSYGAEIAYELEHKDTALWKKCAADVARLLVEYPNATLQQLQDHLKYDKIMTKRVYVSLL
jgi:hypothetical protein